MFCDYFNWYNYMYFGYHFFFKGYIPFIIIKYWLKLPHLKLVSSLGLSFHPKSGSWPHVSWWDQCHCCRVGAGEGLFQSVLFRCCRHAASATFLLPVFHLAWLGLCTPGESPFCSPEILSAEAGGREGDTGEAVGTCLLFAEHLELTGSTWSWRGALGVGSPMEALCTSRLDPHCFLVGT